MRGNRGPAAAFRVAAMSLGVSCALHRVLARTRQPVLGRYLGLGRVSAAARRVAARRLVSHVRHDRRCRRNRRAERVLSARPRPVSCGAGWHCGEPFALSAALAAYTATVIASGRTRSDRRHERELLHARGLSSQRDLHRHRRCRCRSRGNRFRGRPTPTGHVVLGGFGRDCRPVYQYIESGGSQFRRHTTGAERCPSPSQWARSGHR